MKKNAAQYINQDSGNVELYTPGNVVEAARRTLGVIDLDPCSSVRANATVRAARYFSKKDDGLRRIWRGNVWMNHPFSREENPLWIRKILQEYEHGLVRAACCITYASTSERWFEPLLHYPQCFLVPRTNYFLPNGKIHRGVTKGSVVTYLGKRLHAFRDNFADLGVVKV